MSWQTLLANRRLRNHATSRQEIADLLAVASRDIGDAQVPGLSPDRSFATSYNAILQLSKAVIACSGYRVVGQGHHQTTFEALEIAMGHSVSNLVAYFDLCRVKRNFVEYDKSGVATKTESEDLLVRARQFQRDVETWIQNNFPQFL